MDSNPYWASAPKRVDTGSWAAKQAREAETRNKAERDAVLAHVAEAEALLVQVVKDDVFTVMGEATFRKIYRFVKGREFKPRF